jgi:hypothetical protein
MKVHAQCTTVIRAIVAPTAANQLVSITLAPVSLATSDQKA